MAKKKKVSPKSRQRLDAQPVDPLRAGQRAMLPHHVPFVDWAESGPMSDALDPRQAAESLAVTLALPIGVLLDGRYGSAPLSLTAADVAGLAVDLRQIAPTAVQDCLASVEVWVDFLVDAGRWRGGDDGATDVLDALHAELGGGPAFADDDADEEEESPPEVLRETAAGIPLYVFLDWAVQSPLARAADVLLTRADDGSVVTDMEGQLHAEEWPILTAGMELDSPGEVVEAVWRTLRDEGVLVEGEEGIVAAGPDVDAWRLPGRDRVSICLQMARRVLDNLHGLLLLESEDDHDGPLAILLPIVVCLLGSDDLILPADDVERALPQALSAMVGSEFVDDADVRVASSVVRDLRCLGMLEVEDATLVVADPWLTVLSRFVDAHETVAEPDVLGNFEDLFLGWLEESGEALSTSPAETVAVIEETLATGRELDALTGPAGFSARALSRALTAVTHDRAAARECDERGVRDEVALSWWQYLKFLHEDNAWRGDRDELRACVALVRDLLPAEQRSEAIAAQAHVDIDEAEEAAYLGAALPVQAARAMMGILWCSGYRGGSCR